MPTAVVTDSGRLAGTEGSCWVPVVMAGPPKMVCATAWARDAGGKPPGLYCSTVPVGGNSSRWSADVGDRLRALGQDAHGRARRPRPRRSRRCRASAPDAPRAAPRRRGGRCASTTRAWSWMLDWIWTCHWSGVTWSDCSIALRKSRGEAWRLEQLAVGAVAREAVAALGGAHDQPAGLDDLRRGRHALDRLVEVLVERIAGVARDRRRRTAAGTACMANSPRGLAGGGVHRPELAARRPRSRAARG